MESSDNRILSYNKQLVPLAKHMRKNLTDSEQAIWQKIRMKQLCGFQFYRQRPVGNYILDFYCSKAKLAIEIDGGQHNRKDDILNDAEREAYLERKGIKVLRFSNLDVMNNISGVLESILNELGNQNPP